MNREMRTRRCSHIDVRRHRARANSRTERSDASGRRAGALESVLSGDFDRTVSRDVHLALRGSFSLQDRTERDVSITTTLFFALRLEPNTFLYFDPEIAGGRGFSGVNGWRIPRMASCARRFRHAEAVSGEALYLARFRIRQRNGAFRQRRKPVSRTRPMNRYTISVGRFTVTDFFDQNKYSNDPRSQFMAGSDVQRRVDYPADVRGYTWGWCMSCT